MRTKACTFGLRWAFCLGTVVRRRLAENMDGECCRRRDHDESKFWGPRVVSNCAFSDFWSSVRDIFGKGRGSCRRGGGVGVGCGWWGVRLKVEAEVEDGGAAAVLGVSMLC